MESKLPRENEDDDSKLGEILDEITQRQTIAPRVLEDTADQHWDAMTVDERLLITYKVFKLFQEAVDTNRSYRGTLYSVFGFGLNSYAVMFDTGLMEMLDLIDTGKKHQ